MASLFFVAFIAVAVVRLPDMALNYKIQRYSPPPSSSSSPTASPPATMRNATSADKGAMRRPRPRIAAALTTTTTGPGPTTPAPAHAAAPRAAPVVASRKPAAAARDEPRTIARGSRRSRRSGFFCFTAVQAARAVSRGLSAATCVEIKVLRRVRAESSRRPPRHQRDACSMAWRCRFLAARPSQVGRVIAEK